MRRRVLALVPLSLLAACKPMVQAEEPRTMTVSGEGFVMAKPDMAEISVGVLSQGRSAGEALAENTKRMNQLFAIIKGLGIEDKDIQTSNFSVTPRYAAPDPSAPGRQMTIAGYDASNDLSVRIRDLSKLGDALDRFVTAAGANNLRGISFDFANPDPLLDEARKNAVAEARRKAELYAQAAEVKLGPVRSIGESGGYYPKAAYAGRAMAMEASAVPTAPGETRVSANVTLTFGLE